MKKLSFRRGIVLLGITGIFLMASETSAQTSFYTGAEDPGTVIVQAQKPEVDHSHKYLPPSGREGGETYEPPWCIGYCVPGSTPEGEGDIPDGGVDNFNGGCNTPPLYPFSPIMINQIICGRSNTYLVGLDNYRDTDWYEITVTESGVLYWTAIANFDLQIFILNGDCSFVQMLASGSNGGNCSQVQISAPVSPGNYYLWAGPTFFSGMPEGENYNVIATFNEPPPPDWYIAPVPVSNWAIFIAIGLIAAFALFRFMRRS